MQDDAVRKSSDPLNQTESVNSSDINTLPTPPLAPFGRSAQHEEPKKRKHHFGTWLFLIIVIVASIYFYRKHEASAEAEKSKASQAPRAIPITATAATKGDIGVYVSALGTVTPVYTVPVTARVQGEIVALHYNEGQMVKKGDPLIDIDSRPYEATLTQIEGQLAHDQAVLDEARIDLTRYQAAFTRNAIAKQQVDDQEQVVRQDEGTVKNDQGQVAAVQVNIAYCHITSPINGRVGLRLVDLGNMVQANGTTPLVVITQLQPITVIFSISQKYLPQVESKLRQGQKMDVDALDTDDNKKLESGGVLTIDNQVDPTTETFRVKAIFENGNFNLFPQQFVNARLQLDTERGVTLIPTPAIQLNSNGSYVYLVNQDQTVTLRTVKTGTADNNLTAVQGINPGDVVATNGFNNLQDGSKIVVRNGNGNASGGSSAPSTGSNNPQTKGKSGKPAGQSSGGQSSGNGN